MNKQGWEVKKLGELCDSINGLWKGKKAPFKRVGVIRNTNFTKNCQLDITDIEYLEVEEKQYNSRKLVYGDLILEKSGGSPKQPVGRIVPFEINEGDFSFSNFTSVLRIKDKNIIFYRFLYMFLLHFYTSGKTEKLQSNTTGIRNLDLKAYKNLAVPIPQLLIQKQIVNELDKLSEIIANKKKQLAELDKLAQATFYEMFGDPIENDKGWDVKRLDEVCIKITDGTHTSPKFLDTGIPFLFVSNIQNGEINYNTKKYISADEYENLTRITKIEKGDLLYTSVGSYGNPAIVKTDKKFCFQRHIAHLKPRHEIINVIFFHLVMQIDYVKRQAGRLAIGVAQKTLNLSAIKKIIIPLPPLFLQNKFAERIEKIEQQKALIEQSIVDVQLLFDSTMNKYFH